MLDEMYVRGTQVNYYFVCKTKLWLFSKNVSMEQESDLVKLGSLLQRQFFGREEKDVSIGPIAIDVLRRGDEIEIVEVKKSDSIEKADYYQVLYYLYYLSKFGIKAKGRISYPKKKKVIEVRLEENKAIEEVL
ncbi:MAG: Dna2/Cas4 domain-containing protein, partial [Archaeoglobaceae archaeon]